MQNEKCKILFFLFALVLCQACATQRTASHAQHHHEKSAPTMHYQATGMASWYGREFRGRRTASGERFNPNDMTCAHRTLPFGTRLQVTNLSNQQKAVVRVNDRGPFVRGRIIDVSQHAAQVLGFVRQGSVKVRMNSVSGRQSPVTE